MFKHHLRARLAAGAAVVGLASAAGLMLAPAAGAAALAPAASSPIIWHPPATLQLWGGSCSTMMITGAGFTYNEGGYTTIALWKFNGGNASDPSDYTYAAGGWVYVDPGANISVSVNDLQVALPGGVLSSGEYEVEGVDGSFFPESGFNICS